VVGAGTSAIPNRYSTSVLVPSERSFYVRLLQRDFNGAVMYSPTIYVEQKETRSFQVFSRGNNLVVQNLTDNDQLIDLQVYSVDGRLKYDERLQISSGGQTSIGEFSGLSVVLLYEDGALVHNERVFFE
jgi:hypothetical protein